MNWTDQYSMLDRIVHRTAFACTGLQKAIGDIEDTVFASQFSSIACERPIFITSLPRAGTTLLLELLASLSTTATHTYRYMPFLLCPMAWDRISRPFRRDGELRERAHGDGMPIGFDSAEAFEEALWQAWWPSKYRNGRVAQWSAEDEDEDFQTFFVNHLCKVVALGQRHKSQYARRYLSKNNANIARLPLLTRLFPDSTIIIPVRDPRTHVTSLHRQHLRFLQAHAEDEFAKTYMRAIGHLDFGANLAPIDFPGFDGDINSARNLSFWLDYWIAAYKMLTAVAYPQVVFLSYEALCSRSVDTLSHLLMRLEEAGDADIGALAARVEMPRPKQTSVDRLDEARLAEAASIYRCLTRRSITPIRA